MTFRSKALQTTRALWRRQNLTTIATARSTSHVVQRHTQHHPIQSERGGSSSQLVLLGIVRRWQSDNCTSSSSADTTKVGNDQNDTLPTTIQITFLQPDETKRTVDARVGETLLITAHRNEIDLEGACEGVCACSTCHLIFPHKIYDALPEPSEEEEDMLDMAFGLTETSRLGCQVIVTKEMDGMLLEMPKATRNFYVDGHVPKPH